MSYVGNTPADKFLTLEKQQFSVSATTGYTLSHSVSSPQDIALFINNVRQNPNSSYTVSGTTLTLSSPGTSSGDTMYCVFLGKAIGTVGVPVNGVGTSQIIDSNITTQKIADNAVTSAKLASTATVTSLSTASGSAPSYSARAWVNFNGTGTVAIRANGNVSSITDNGQGDYTVNFATAMADTNYMVAFGGITDSGNARRIGHAGVKSSGSMDSSGSYATGSVRIGFCIGDSGNGNAEMFDSKNVDVVVFR